MLLKFWGVGGEEAYSDHFKGVNSPISDLSLHHHHTMLGPKETPSPRLN